MVEVCRQSLLRIATRAVLTTQDHSCSKTEPYYRQRLFPSPRRGQPQARALVMAGLVAAEDYRSSWRHDQSEPAKHVGGQLLLHESTKQARWGRARQEATGTTLIGESLSTGGEILASLALFKGYTAAAPELHHLCIDLMPTTDAVCLVGNTSRRQPPGRVTAHVA